MKNKHVKSAAAISEVFGDGQKIIAAAIEYDRDINTSKLVPSAFSVTNRTITKVYANTTAAKASQGVNGCYVIIELSPFDKEAAILSGGPGGPDGPAGPSGFGGPGGPGNAGGPPMRMPTSKRKPVKVSVAQVGEIITAKGEKYPADARAFETDKAVNLIVDDFLQLEFKDPASANVLKYNLYVPKNYDKNKSYPMVLFMHDASVNSTEHDRTLIQGLGAVVWASPEDQARHPAFVLAPQLNSIIATNDSKTSDMMETIVRLVNSVANQYSIDKNRLYTTGQSAGCMTSLAISIKYPDLFAASLLVAGQWDPQATSVLVHKNMWIVVSEGDFRAFPGMNASVKVWEKEGAKITRGRWSARAPQEEQAANAKRMIDEGNNIQYTLFEKGSTLPPERAQSGGQEHMTSWQFAYAIPAIRDWLFTQSKSQTK